GGRPCALAVREKTLGPEHPDTATSLNDLAARRSRKRLDLRDLDVFAPSLDVLGEQRLQHLRIAGEWVAAQIGQERLRLLVDSNLIEQGFELVEDRLWRALWHMD